MARYEIRGILQAATSLPRFLARKAFTRKPVIYEAHGSGPVLFLGFPITLAPEGDSVLRKRYVDRRTDRYRVIVMDYPPAGRDADIVANRFTPDQVCADILAVADAAGINSFAWYGYSWEVWSAFNSPPERIG